MECWIGPEPYNRDRQQRPKKLHAYRKDTLLDELTGPPDRATLELDGSQKISVPLLGFSHAVAADSGTRFGLTATFDFQSAALDFALNYHLTTQIAIPEPGSVLLMAIGLAALTPVALRRLRR